MRLQAEVNILVPPEQMQQSKQRSTNKTRNVNFQTERAILTIRLNTLDIQLQFLDAKYSGMLSSAKISAQLENCIIAFEIQSMSQKFRLMM